MQPQAGQELHLLDSQQRLLGQVTLEHTEDPLLRGQFVPGPAFPTLEPLCRAFEEAVDLQALSVVDELDAAIAALGLYLRSPDGSQTLFIHDVQIWSDGGITFRRGDPTRAAGNGNPQVTRPVDPVRK